MSTSGPHGILLVDKAPGWTSHDVVGRCRRLLGTRRVGHAGTLDPMATGLLVLGAGQGTRLLTHLVGLPKTYEATIRLGQATTTDDAEGEAIDEPADATGIGAERLETALADLRGEIQQVPSSVSAIKVDGQRAYARVRGGEDVTLPARPVTISRLEVRTRRSEGAFCDLDVVVDCSSGTYIRAIARDLGAALGVGGHLTALRRTRVGPFAVADACTVPTREEGDAADLPLLGLGEAAAAVMRSLPVTEEAAVDLGHGKRPVADVPEDLPPGARSGVLAARDAEARLVAIVEAEPAGGSADAAGTCRRASLRPVLVIPPDART